MNFKKAFGGDYLKAEDITGKRVAVTIESVEMEKLGEDERLVVRFAGKAKGLVLNKTNGNMIAEIAGTDETDDWAGVRIVLFDTKVDYQGKRVPAIRVDYVPNGRPVPEPVDPDDDTIPF